MIGSATRVIARGVTLAVAFFLVPFMLRHLGEYHYGIWTLAATFLGYYGLADFGLGSAVSRFASRALGTGDDKDFRTIVATSFHILFVIGGIVLGISLGVAFLVRFLTEDPEKSTLFFWIVVILGINMAAQAPLRSFTGLLTSHLRYDMLSITQIFQVITRAALIYIFFTLGFGLLSLVIISAAMDIAVGLFRAALSFRVHPGLQFKRSDISRKRARELFGYGFFTMVAQVSDLLRFRIAPYIITVFRGAALVAPYGVAMHLEESVGKLVIAIVSVLSPVFSRYDGSGDQHAMKRLFLFSTRVSTYISMLLGGMMIILGYPFLKRWLQGADIALAQVYTVSIILVGAAMTAGAQHPSVNFLYGTSRHKFYAGINIVQGIVTLVLCSVLIFPLGLIGVAIGTAAPAVIVRLAVHPIYVCKQLSLNPLKFYLSTLFLSMLYAGIYLGAFAFVAHRYLEPSYLSVFSWAAGGCILFVPYIMYIGFTHEQRKRLFKIVAEKVRKSRKTRKGNTRSIEAHEIG